MSICFQLNYSHIIQYSCQICTKIMLFLPKSVMSSHGWLEPHKIVSQKLNFDILVLKLTLHYSIIFLVLLIQGFHLQMVHPIFTHLNIRNSISPDKSIRLFQVMGNIWGKRVKLIGFKALKTSFLQWFTVNFYVHADPLRECACWSSKRTLEFFSTPKSLSPQKWCTEVSNN
jgi:hypothetical protein